jgi:hypothetical protein
MASCLQTPPPTKLVWHPPQQIQKGEMQMRITRLTILLLSTFIGWASVASELTIPESSPIEFNDKELAFLEGLKDLEKQHFDNKKVWAWMPLVQVLASGSPTDVLITASTVPWEEVMKTLTNLDIIFAMRMATDIRTYIVTRKPKGESRTFFLELEKYYLYFAQNHK